MSNIGDLFFMKEDIEYPDDEMIIYEIIKVRRSNTEIKLNILNESYYSFSSPWINIKQLNRKYRPLTNMEKLIYV